MKVFKILLISCFMLVVSKEAGKKGKRVSREFLFAESIIYLEKRLLKKP